MSLKIYDIIGREVTTLVNEVKSPGTYTVQFAATGLASGMYFYRLSVQQERGGKATDFVATKKMLVLK